MKTTPPQESDLIYLPVSVGEAMDKLTILDIKRQRIINSDKKKQVELEYHLLLQKLGSAIQSVGKFYHLLKILNEEIWDQMDILRNHQNKRDEYYAQLCLDCIQYNDRRFRIKNKINHLSKSGIKEQKGYDVFTKGLDAREADSVMDLEELRKILQYTSILYDRVVVLVDSESYDPLQHYFENDPTVEIIMEVIPENNIVLEKINTFEKKNNETRKKYWDFL